ncbi:MAG: amino acid ABC transporter substrate-binding protein [Chloroflexi bacterium]|nr:amino acid ABC transporter substrate-binding protein [Chloroflexota bacterium]
MSKLFARYTKLTIHTTIIWILCGLLFPNACRPQDVTWQQIQESGILRVGLDPTYPPFETAAENNIYGFDIDLANALAQELGLQAEFVLFGYDGLYDALGTKQVDVLISALVIIPERTRDFAYSKPYFNAGEILIVPLNNQTILEMADMNDRTLAVELGALGHVEAITWAKRLPDLTVVPYPSADEALSAVSAGNTDAALVDAISGHLYLQNEPRLKRVTEPITVEPFAIVTRIEDEKLQEQIDSSLAHLQQSDQLVKIHKRWLGP